MKVSTIYQENKLSRHHMGKTIKVKLKSSKEAISCVV